MSKSFTLKMIGIASFTFITNTKNVFECFRTVATIEFTDMVLDGLAPSSSPDVCYKRREYLVVKHYDHIENLTPAYNKDYKGTTGNSHQPDSSNSEEGYTIYCGDWSTLQTQNSTKNNETTPSMPKHLHFIGKSDISERNTKNRAFIILYVVRSAMPPLMDDEKRHQHRHGFKLKAS